MGITRARSLHAEAFTIVLVVFVVGVALLIATAAVELTLSDGTTVGLVALIGAAIGAAAVPPIARLRRRLTAQRRGENDIPLPRNFDNSAKLWLALLSLLGAAMGYVAAGPGLAVIGAAFGAVIAGLSLAFPLDRVIDDTRTRRNRRTRPTAKNGG